MIAENKPIGLRAAAGAKARCVSRPSGIAAPGLVAGLPYS